MTRDLHFQSNPLVQVDKLWTDPNCTVVDVRSPKEYADGHIPGALNIPLLENNERHIVGILYKQYGQDRAIAEGYDILDSKLAFFASQFQDLSQTLPVYIYCARGGMRSRVVTAFLRNQSFDARQLEGGYKTFRSWNIAQLNHFKFNYPLVLHGKTGVGKTLVLNRLPNSLDLEGLADHRGSIFGGIGKNPVTQKTFEAELLRALQAVDNSKPVFIEGESRKIGDVSLPSAIFNQMSASKKVLLEASMSTRVRRTIAEYIDLQPHKLAGIRSTIQQLAKELGKKPVARLIRLFDEKEYTDCIEYILQHYYDKRYAHSMRELVFVDKVSTEDLEQACDEILKLSQQILG